MMALRVAGVASRELAQLRSVTGLQPDEPLGTSTSSVTAVPNYRHNTAPILVSTMQRPEDGTSQESTEHLWRKIFEDPTQWLDNRRNKANPRMPDFTHAATGEGLWIENRSKPGWVQAKLSCLQEAKAGPGRARWAPDRLENGVALFEDQDTVEQLWQKYFKDPTEWWDNRSSKLHPNSPDFRHKSTNEALTIDNWNTPEWARQALLRETPSETDCEDSMETATLSSADCISGAAVDFNLAQRKQLSWSARISQHTTAGQGRQALKIYEQMKRDGVKMSSYIFVAALKACGSLQDLDSCKDVHAHVVKSGFESNLYVGTMLVNTYVKCGSLVDARCVFEKMPHRDVVSWTAMILGYAQREAGEEALQLFTRMQEEGVVPNDRTYVGALKACSSLVTVEQGNESDAILLKTQCLEQVRAIHAHVVKTGSESDVFVGTMLVDVYAKCGNLVEARRVFEKMPHRNVVSWNAMILGYSQMEGGEEALHLYSRMQREGVVPDQRTFIGALKACSSLTASKEGTQTDGFFLKHGCLEQVRAIHSDVVKKDFESDVFVGSILVDVYAKCGSLVEARAVFEKMPHRNVVSWTAMILGYAQMEEGEVALQLYTKMQQEGVVPNDRTFVGALKACSSLAAFEEGDEGDGVVLKKKCLEVVKAIHSDVVKSGSESDVFVGTMLVDVYAKCGSLVDARQVFENMPRRNVVSWNAMILGYVQLEDGEVALELYKRMPQEGVLPNDRTFVGALKACGILAASEVGIKAADGKVLKERSLEHVRAIHADVVKIKFQSDVFVGTMLVDVYAKCGSLVDARQVFEEMHHRDVVSWTAMILGYAQMEEGDVALQMFERMLQEGIVPDDTTFIGALKACGCVSALEKGKEIHAQISNVGIEATDSFLASALIDMYGKCGSMADAQQVFDAWPTRDLVTWNALLAGYARQGENEHVFDLFQRMRRESILPNSVTFLSVLSVCNHVGLLDKGLMYFEAMRTDYGVNPTIDHYTCMVDLLGRAGRLDKAMAMVKTMPFQPDSALWQTVLGACQKWRDLEIGRQAFECAIRLDKNDPAAYVLMSNIYAAWHMWEEAREIQATRLQIGAFKKPGQSWWTDIDGIVHTFAVGDTNHPESPQIYAEIGDLLVRMLDEGYLAHSLDMSGDEEVLLTAELLSAPLSRG